VSGSSVEGLAWGLKNGKSKIFLLMGSFRGFESAVAGMLVGLFAAVLAQLGCFGFWLSDTILGAFCIFSLGDVEVGWL